MSLRRRAGWWRMVLLVPLAGMLFVVEEGVTAPAQAHAVMQVAIFLITIGLMALWVHSDEAAATREAASRLIVIDLLDVNTSDASRMPQRVVETPPVHHRISYH